MPSTVVPRTNRAIIVLVLCALAMAIPGCQKIEQRRPAPAPLERGDLIMQPTTVTDSIPLEYGRFVAVIPHARSDQWAGLWFEGEDQTITVVWVNVVEGRIYDETLHIPRR